MRKRAETRLRHADTLLAVTTVLILLDQNSVDYVSGRPLALAPCQCSCVCTFLVVLMFNYMDSTDHLHNYMFPSLPFSLCNSSILLHFALSPFANKSHFIK